MNKLKRTLALVATLAISATAFVGCGDEESSSEAKTDSPAAEATDAPVADDGAEATEAPVADDGGEATMSLPSGGDKMTILAWNANDVDPMLSFWLPDKGYTEDQINFVNYNCGGGEASANYDQYFLGDEDCDVFMVEADWALKYINDEALTAPLSQLGFADSAFDGQYGYVKEIGKDSNGVIKGSSWQAAPGAWCYRSDLAETYLGVTSIEEMQAKVDSWDNFKATAAEVKEASGGKTALTTTLGGIWQVYAASRSTPWVVDGKLAVDDYCTEFVNFAKEMRDNGYVTDLGQWNDDWYAAGQTDDTMGYFVSTWGFGDSILTAAAGGEGGATYGKWSCVEGPNPYFWGGTWMCVSPKTDNADMVASFIEYFTINEESMKKYALEKDGGEYVNNVNVMQAIVDSGENGIPVLNGQDQFAIVHENAKSLNLEGLITPNDAPIKTAFLDAVNAYCNGETGSVDDCINDFKMRVSTSVTDITVE